jgi:hypothetical protein
LGVSDRFGWCLTLLFLLSWLLMLIWDMLAARCSAESVFDEDEDALTSGSCELHDDTENDCLHATAEL